MFYNANLSVKSASLNSSAASNKPFKTKAKSTSLWSIYNVVISIITSAEKNMCLNKTLSNILWLK